MAKVWLFPHTQKNSLGPLQKFQVLDLNLLISVTTPSMAGEKKKRITVQWNQTNTCLSVDVSIPVRKLLKQIQLRDGVLGNISIQITGVKKSKERSKIPTEALLYTTQLIDDEYACQELGSRNFTKPFLVLGYVGYKVLPRTYNETSKLTRRNVEVLHESNNAEGNENEACSPRELKVNLTKHISTIVYPQVINIRDCRGECSDKMLNAHSFFKKAYQHANNQSTKDGSGDERMQEGPCCTTGHLSSLWFISKTANENVFELREMPETIVESCRCI